MNHTLSVTDVASLDSASSSSQSYLKHDEHHPYTVHSPSTISHDGDKSSVQLNQIGVNYTVKSPLRLSQTLSQDGDRSSVQSNQIGANYTVQSPSTESQDGDKSSFPGTTSPPRISSTLSSSGSSSGSRISGARRNWNWNFQRHEKGWNNRCYVIVEEKEEKSSQRWLWLVWALLVFGLVCLVVWGFATHYRPWVAVESLAVNNFDFGQGSDYTGVPTKFLTINCTLHMKVRNPAKYFGMHISSTSVVLSYLDITIATGQMRTYYQPRKSEQILALTLKGSGVPLYGAGSSLAITFSQGAVPVRLGFDIQSHVFVVWKIVKTNHLKHISCSANIPSSNKGVVRFKENSCKYD